MEALIVGLLFVLIGGVAVVGWLFLNQRQETEDTESPQIALELANLKRDLTQAVTASQQTMLGQVNALDQKINQRLDAVQTSR